MQRREYIDWFFILLGSFIVIYIALPIVMIVLQQGAESAALRAALADDIVIDALKNSLATSSATMLLALVFGVPLGYLLARTQFRAKALVQSIVDVPIVIPHSVVGIMLLATFSGAILDSYLAIVMAMFFVAAPFTVNASRDGFLAVDERLEHVARTLGASKARAIATISIPIALPSIITGAIMTWARSISEVGAILIVAYYPKTAQVLTLEYFEQYGMDASRPIAVILILLSLSVFAILRWLIGRSHRA